MLAVVEKGVGVKMGGKCSFRSSWNLCSTSPPASAKDTTQYPSSLSLLQILLPRRRINSSQVSLDLASKGTRIKFARSQASKPACSKMRAKAAPKESPIKARARSTDASLCRAMAAAPCHQGRTNALAPELVLHEKVLDIGSLPKAQGEQPHDFLLTPSLR